MAGAIWSFSDRLANGNGDVVFQCKFVKDLIRCQAQNRSIARCVSEEWASHGTMDSVCTGANLPELFMDWLNGELEKRRY